MLWKRCSPSAIAGVSETLGAQAGGSGLVLADLTGLQRLGPTGVVLAAGEATVQLGDEERAVAVLGAEGAGAHLAEGGGFLTAHVTLMPWTLPATYTHPNKYIHGYSEILCWNTGNHKNVNIH